MDFTFFIVVIVLAIVADVIYVRWRARRRPTQTPRPATPAKAESVIVTTPQSDRPDAESVNVMASQPDLPDKMLTQPSALTTDVTNESISTEQPQLRGMAASLPTGLVGLMLILAAQAAVALKQPLVGLGGYLIGGILFVRGMHNLIPEAAELSDQSNGSATFKSLNIQELFARPNTPKPQSAAKPVVPPPAGTTPSFWKYWRYYTVANLIKGTTPNIPTPPTPPVETEPVVEELRTAAPEAILPPPPQPVTNFDPPAREAAPVLMKAEETSPAPAPSERKEETGPATVQPTGHHQTRLMVVSPLEEVLVVDIAHNALFHFDPNGNLLQQFKADHLADNLTAADITFSHDGNTAYVFNPDTARLQVYKLK